MSRSGGAAPRWASLWAGLADLVLPTACAGCRAPQVPLRFGVCDGCATDLEAAVPAPVRPRPSPPGLPPCVAVGPYDGALRAVLLDYKEHGRHRLARPLGVLLAGAVHQVCGGAPVVLVPVPSTARAIRQRHGDHLVPLARQAAHRLRSVGTPAVVRQPLRALPRPDSAGLDRSARAAAAAASVRLRPGALARLRCAAPDARVVVVDDVVTTGATLAVVSDRLRAAGVPVRGAAVLAATRLRQPPRRGVTAISR